MDKNIDLEEKKKLYDAEKLKYQELYNLFFTATESLIFASKRNTQVISELSKEIFENQNNAKEDGNESISFVQFFLVHQYLKEDTQKICFEEFNRKSQQLLKEDKNEEKDSDSSNSSESTTLDFYKNMTISSLHSNVTDIEKLRKERPDDFFQNLKIPWEWIKDEPFFQDFHQETNFQVFFEKKTNLQVGLTSNLFCSNEKVKIGNQEVFPIQNVSIFRQTAPEFAFVAFSEQKQVKSEFLGGYRVPTFTFPQEIQQNVFKFLNDIQKAKTQQMVKSMQKQQNSFFEESGGVLIIDEKDDEKKNNQEIIKESGEFFKLVVNQVSLDVNSLVNTKSFIIYQSAVLGEELQEEIAKSFDTFFEESVNHFIKGNPEFEESHIKKWEEVINKQNQEAAKQIFSSPESKSFQKKKSIEKACRTAFYQLWDAKFFSQELLTTFLQESSAGDYVFFIRHECSVTQDIYLPETQIIHGLLYVKLGKKLLGKNHPLYTQWNSSEFILTGYGVICKRIFARIEPFFVEKDNNEIVSPSICYWFADLPSFSMDDPLITLSVLRQLLIHELKVRMPLFSPFKKEWKPDQTLQPSKFDYVQSCQVEPFKSKEESYPNISEYFLAKFTHLDPFELIEIIDKNADLQMNNVYLGLSHFPYRFVHPFFDSFYVLLVEEFESLFVLEQAKQKKRVFSHHLLKEKGVWIFHSEIRVNSTLETIRVFTCFVLFHSLDETQKRLDLVSFYPDQKRQFQTEKLASQVASLIENNKKCEWIGHVLPQRIYTKEENVFFKPNQSQNSWKISRENSLVEIERKNHSQKSNSLYQNDFFNHVFSSIESLLTMREMNLPILFGFPVPELIHFLFLFGRINYFLITPNIKQNSKFDVWMLTNRSFLLSLFHSKKLKEKITSSVLFGVYQEDRFVLRVSSNAVLEKSSSNSSIPNVRFFFELDDADVFYGISPQKFEKINQEFFRMSQMDHIPPPKRWSGYIDHIPQQTKDPEDTESTTGTFLRRFPGKLEINEDALKLNQVHIALPKSFSKNLYEHLKQYCDETQTILRFDSVQRLQSDFLAEKRSHYQIPVSELPKKIQTYTALELKELLFQYNSSFV